MLSQSNDRMQLHNLLTSKEQKGKGAEGMVKSNSTGEAARGRR